MSATARIGGERRGARHALQDLELLRAIRVGDLQLEHEAVDLGLGQRIGAVVLQRVLGREHQERLGQRVGLVADRDLVFLHRLQQRALHLGRRAVDLVGEQQIGEHRPLAHAELARLRLVDQRADQVGGQQVGGELNPLITRVQGLGERGHRQGLGDAGNPLDQHVAIGEEADQQPFQHVALADDDLLHRADHVRAEMARSATRAGDPIDRLQGRPGLDARAVMRIRCHLLASKQCVGSGSDLSQGWPHGKYCRGVPIRLRADETQAPARLSDARLKYRSGRQAQRSAAATGARGRDHTPKTFRMGASSNRLQSSSSRCSVRSRLTRCRKVLRRPPRIIG